MSTAKANNNGKQGQSKASRKGKVPQAQLPSFSPAQKEEVEKLIRTRLESKSLQAWRPPIPKGVKIFNAMLQAVAHQFLDTKNSEMVRLPDSTTKKTALFKDISLFEIPVYFANPPDPIHDGRFSIHIRPGLGSINPDPVTGLVEPENFKLAVVNASGGWPTNMALAGSYFSSLGGTDPRLSKFYAALTQQKLGLLALTGSVWAATTAPLGSTQAPVGNFSYSISPLITNDSISNSLTFGPGVYLLMCECATLAGGLLNITASTPTPGSLNIDFQGPTVSTGGTQARTTVLFTVTGHGGTLTLTEAGPAAPTSSSLWVSTTWSPGTQASANKGDVVKYRTVGMDACFTSKLPRLMDGGEVCATRFGIGVAGEKYFTEVPDPVLGDLHFVEKLGQLEGSLPLPHMEGAFTWWTMGNVTDMEFRSPSDEIDYEQHTLVISGQVVPGGTTIPTPGSSIIAGFLQVSTVYEVVTENMMYDLDVQIGDDEDLKRLFAFLAMQPYSMGNPMHIEWLKKAFPKLASFSGDLATWWKNNQSWVVPLGGAALKALSAL